jgi:hypothetical protein
MNLQLSVHDLQLAPPTAVIIVGDALEVLRKRPAGSVHTADDLGLTPAAAVQP